MQWTFTLDEDNKEATFLGSSWVRGTSIAWTFYIGDRGGIWSFGLDMMDSVVDQLVDKYELRDDAPPVAQSTVRIRQLGEACEAEQLEDMSRPFVYLPHNMITKKSVEDLRMVANIIKKGREDDVDVLPLGAIDQARDLLREELKGTHLEKEWIYDRIDQIWGEYNAHCIPTSKMVPFFGFRPQKLDIRIKGPGRQVEDYEIDLSSP